MRHWISSALCALALLGSQALAQTPGWNDKHLYDEDLHKAYMEKVEAALGTFNDIPVWEWGWDEAEKRDQWNLLNGEYIPVTIDGKAPKSFFTDMRSDRPMMLPTRVEGFHGGDGQSNPYSVVGRMPGSNPEVQWLFLVRKYFLKKPTDQDFIDAGDIAIIGHHPRTGASTYFQYYDPAHPKSAQSVISPFSGEEGMYFWSPLTTQAEIFQCQRCHSADPFLHTPWIDQVRVAKPSDANPFPEPMVPSNPLGPFFFIDSQDGGLFNFWDDNLRHLHSPENKCTECHRVTPWDLAGLYQNSTRYAGVEPQNHDQFAVEMHGYQTDDFTFLPWMPPVSLADFYAGQSDVEAIWMREYLKDAAEVNTLTPADSQKLRRVPRPPVEYQDIMAERPHTDKLAPGQVMAVVDARMRANTDATLAEWRFRAAEAASDGMTARPAVLRRVPTPGGTHEFKVLFVGTPQDGSTDGDWIAFEAAYDLKLGDYLALILENTGTTEGAALVPYTVDDWARINWPDGSPRYPDSIITHNMRLDTVPKVGDTLSFTDMDYRTYAFEMQNRL